MAESKRKIPEINAASMADIAFLLLIFFLMLTTIASDKGIFRKLPPWPDENTPPPEVDVNQRNVFIILVNSQDRLLVEGDVMNVRDLREATKEFIANPAGRKDLAVSPQEAVVSLKADRGTSYDMYITVNNELAAAYNELRDEYAQRKFQTSYEALEELAKNDKIKEGRDAIH